MKTLVSCPKLILMNHESISSKSVEQISVTDFFILLGVRNG